MRASQVGTEPTSGEGGRGTQGSTVAPGRMGVGGLAGPVEEIKLIPAKLLHLGSN